ncbi:SOS response-associated peptidase [Pollutibacter soli]|uniref:SOS response-associated peptidase n=1 Tax=Pollutibacter soli TaxID=3034157 RepID=UPI0030137CBB
MCFYNGIIVKRAEHIRLNKIEKEILQYDIQLKIPMQSGFAFGNWPVIKLKEGGGDFELVMMHWELIPFYLKTQSELEHFRKGGLNPKTGKIDPPRNTLNAIGEEVLDKVTYKQAVLKRRCLVLSSGFYEWRHYKSPGAKKESTYPYRITLKDKEYFFMAGIWQPWTDQESGEMINSFAILTTAANPLMEQIHNKKKRMPVILPDELAWQWIQEGLTENQIRELARYQLPESAMEAYTIAKDFRESEDPTAPYSYPELSQPQQSLF